MKLLEKLRPTERTIPILLFLFVSSVYFMTVTGITASNDGGQYAATRAFADHGRFDIAPYFPFVEEQDYALDRHGVAHAHSAPGTALIASVTYRLGQLLPEPVVQVPSKHDPDNPDVIFAVLTAVLAGSAAILLFYSLLRQHFQVSATAALLASLMLAFATATWKYGATLYSHPLASLSLLVTLHVVLRAERHGAFAWADGFLLGLALGMAALFEYTNAVLVALVLFYLAFTWGRTFLADLRDPAARRSWLTVLGAAALGSGLPFAFFAIYNITFYGGPFQLSYYFVDPVRWACCSTLSANFGGNLLQGMQGFLFYGNANQGLFLLTPVSILAFLGWKALFQHSQRNFALILGTFAIFLLLFSKRSIPNPGTDDGRYLVPFLSLWFIPFGLWLDRIYFRIQREMPRALVSLLLFGLLFLSVRNIGAHITLSWGYNLNLADLENRSMPPHNLALIGSTLFPNAPNLPLLWLLEIIALALGAAFVRAWRALTPRLRPVLVAAVAALSLGYALAPAVGALSDPTPPGMTPLATHVGDDLTLLGYQLSRWKADPQPGDPVRVRLYWRLDAPVRNEIDVKLALMDETGTTWGGVETPLGHATFRQIPPMTWPTGRAIQEEYTLPLDAPPPYALQTDVVLTAADQTVTLFSLYPATHVLATPPEQAVHYTFEELAHLIGYDVEPLPHHRLALTLHWQVTSTTDVAYKTFVHIVAPDGTIAAQRDLEPFEGRHPTTAWQPGDALVHNITIQLGRAFPQGTYTLRVGLYNPDDGTRLTVTDSRGQPVYDNAVILGEIALP